MADKPRESLRKRIVHKGSKLIEHLKHGSKDSPVAPPPLAPPNLSQGSGQHLEASPLVQSTQSLLAPEDPTTHLPGEPSAGTANTTAGGAVLVATAPSSAHEPGEHPPAAQILKFVGKGTLGLLSNAAEGIPIPGVKGIFDTITKVIGAIEETQVNREGFKELESRCQSLVDTVTTVPFRPDVQSRVTATSELN